MIFNHRNPSHFVSATLGHDAAAVGASEIPWPRAGWITVPLRAAVIAVLTLLALSGSAQAQLKGHYIPGFTGLDNGSQPPPSITVAVPFFVYPTDTIKDDTGTTIPGNE